MSDIFVPPLENLALALKHHFGIRNFVETGTYQGLATAWAAANFERVWTIEVREDLMAAVRAQWGYLTNVDFILGDSAHELDKVCKQLTSPALFWLDAHAGGGYYGTEECCPLIEEIASIEAGDLQHYLLIDDARAFLAPPPPPFDYRKWPSLDEVIATLTRKRPWNVVVFDDVIICVPPAARPVVVDFACRQRPYI